MVLENFDSDIPILIPNHWHPILNQQHSLRIKILLLLVIVFIYLLDFVRINTILCFYVSVLFASSFYFTILFV